MNENPINRKRNVLATCLLPIVHCPLSIAHCLLLIAYCLLPIASSAQGDTVIIKHKIAIFAPLYLDSAFDQSNEYKYAKNVFPKFINPGLEFFEGAQLALDSLNEEGVKLEVFIYDTRSTKESIQQQLAKPEIADANLIIAHCSNNEVRLLSETALKRQVPVINATVPNDAGTTANPYFIVLNPTLKTQCEGIYRWVQKNHSNNQIVVFRRKGTSDDAIKNLFNDYGKSTVGTPLKLRYVEINEDATADQLISYLSSERNTVCIAGSLDLNFGRNLALQLASLVKDYPVTVIGMPTWDAIKDFSKPEYKGIEIIYSTPFYNSKMDKVSQSITTYFNTSMYARPSDMVFRGYEVTWKFARLLLKYGKDLPSNLGNKQDKVFTDFDIQPVVNKKTTELDYFENKRLYFVKWHDGIIKGVSY